jgi:hypothetical protein
LKNFSPIQSKCLTRFLIENSISSSKTGISISTDNTAFGIDQNTQCLNINNISNLKSLKTGSLILNVSLINTNLNNLLCDSISCNIYVTKKCEQEFYAVASDNILIDNSNYITRFILKQINSKSNKFLFFSIFSSVFTNLFKKKILAFIHKTYDRQSLFTSDDLIQTSK